MRMVLSSLDELEAAIRPDTDSDLALCLQTMRLDTIQPIKEIGEIAKEHDIIFHTDAVQALWTGSDQCRRDAY